MELFDRIVEVQFFSLPTSVGHSPHISILLCAIFSSLRNIWWQCTLSVGVFFSVSISVLRECVLPFFPCVQRIYLFVFSFGAMTVAYSIDKCIISLKIVCEAHSVELERIRCYIFRTLTDISMVQPLLFKAGHFFFSLSLCRFALFSALYLLSLSLYTLYASVAI